MEKCNTKLPELSNDDKERFEQIQSILTLHLGSEVANLWLITPGRGFDGTPQDAIHNGMADLVLETIKEQFGPNPPYA